MLKMLSPNAAKKSFALLTSWAKKTILLFTKLESKCVATLLRSNKLSSMRNNANKKRIELS